MHGHVDVWLEREEPLDVGPVLGCVGATVNGDVVRIRLLDDGGQPHVLVVVPHVVREQVDTRPFGSGAELGLVPHETRTEVVRVVQCAVVESAGMGQNHAEARRRAGPVGVHADHRNSRDRPIGVGVHLEPVERRGDPGLGPHALPHELCLVCLTVGLALIGVERRQELRVERAMHDLVEGRSWERGLAQLLVVGRERRGRLGGEPELREREQLFRGERHANVAVVVQALEPSSPAAEQHRVRQHEHRRR